MILSYNSWLHSCYNKRYIRTLTYHCHLIIKIKNKYIKKNKIKKTAITKTMAGLVLVSILKYAEAENNAKMLHWISLKIVRGELYRFLKINHLFSEMMFSKTFIIIILCRNKTKQILWKFMNFCLKNFFKSYAQKNNTKPAALCYNVVKKIYIAHMIFSHLRSKCYFIFVEIQLRKESWLRDKSQKVRGI